MNNSIPVCVNCKYFLSEPIGIHRLKSACAISAIDPVTGEETGKAKHAAQYRKENGLCGPVGKFFEAGKVKPKKEKPKPEVKTVDIEVPTLTDLHNSIMEPVVERCEKALSDHEEKAAQVDGGPEDLDPNGVDDQVTIVEPKEPELLPLEPGKKRRRRAK